MERAQVAPQHFKGNIQPTTAKNALLKQKTPKTIPSNR